MLGVHPRTHEEWEEFYERCNNPHVSCTVQGQLLTYKVRRPSLIAPGARRGAIRDFSPASRLRMLKRFCAINWDGPWRPIFITLTYPDERAYTTRDQRNIHRKVMARHLEALTGREMPAAWRVEWAIRKKGFWSGVPCPHHHWLVFGHRFIHRDDVNALWRKTIGWDDYCRTETKAVDKHGCTQMYMAKYISKDAVPLSLVNAAYQNRIGRQYGWLRKAQIPWHDERTHSEVSQAQRDTLMQLANEQLPWLSEGWEESFTLMGKAAEDASKILEVNTLDGNACGTVHYLGLPAHAGINGAGGVPKTSG